MRSQDVFCPCSFISKPWVQPPDRHESCGAVVQVRAQDWQAALSQAPQPCSQRSALQSEPCLRRHLSQYTNPAVWRLLATALALLHQSSVPMAPAVARLGAAIPASVSATKQGALELQTEVLEDEASQLQAFGTSLMELLQSNMPIEPGFNKRCNHHEDQDAGGTLLHRVSNWLK